MVPGFSLSLSLGVFLCIIASPLSAQRTIDYPAPPEEDLLNALADTCLPPHIVSTSVAHYKTFSNAYLGLYAIAENPVIRFKRPEDALFREATATGGALLLTHLESNSIYELFSQDNCGNSAMIGLVDTKTGRKEALDLSENLYNHIKKYLKEKDRGRIYETLDRLQDVSIYEKIAFVQQFYLDGELLDPAAENQMPPVGRSGGDSCRCRFILNTSQLAIPSNQSSNPNVVNRVEAAQWPKAGLGNDASYWWNRHNKGAAKWHQVYTEGYGANQGQTLSYEQSYIDSNSVAPQYAKLRVTLFCDGFQSQEFECACEKEFRFWWGYDTRLETYAVQHSGVSGSKRSFGIAEDIAVVIYKNEETEQTEILQAGAARSTANCNHLVNPDFWTKTTDLAGAIVSIFYPADSFNTQTIDNVANTLAAFLQTPYFDTATCGNGSELTTTLVSDYEFKTIQPNQPVEVILHSMDKIKSGGMRGWYSHARITSNFYLAGYIAGGQQQNEGAYCCSPKFCNWIYATCDGPLDADNLERVVGSFLYSYQPWNMPADHQQGVVLLPGEFGWDAKSDPAGCTGVVVNPDEGEGFGAIGGNRHDLAPPLPVHVTVWDVSGKMVSQSTLDASTDIRIMLASMRETLVPGIYFVSCKDPLGVETYKFFID
jgi:hypothetical protein